MSFIIKRASIYVKLSTKKSYFLYLFFVTGRKCTRKKKEVRFTENKVN